MPSTDIPNAAPIMSGRSILRTDLDAEKLTEKVLRDDVMRVLPMHASNRTDIRALQDYHKGWHPYVQNRVKTTRTDVDNKITVNLPWSTTRDITSYFLGRPVQYVHRRGKYRVQMENLAGALDAENKALVDKQIADDCSICGLGYRGMFHDDKPRNGTHLSLIRLEPQDTFVVYSSDPTKGAVYAVTFYDSAPSAGVAGSGAVDTTGAVRFYKVYTPKKMYVYKDTVGGGQEPMVGAKLELVSTTDIFFGGGLPIVEYQNNLWRMGDWECAISLLDAIDCVTSDGVNDIQQAVNSILVALGFEMDAEKFSALSKHGFLNIANIPQGVNPSAEFISQPMNADVGVAMRDYLEAMFRIVVGVPDRKSRPGGGGDTGDAVFMRDGWQDIDLVVTAKEPYFVQAERDSLAVMLYILETNKEIKSIAATDIEVHFSRNKTSNAQSKAQVYQILTTGEAALDPADALAIADLTHNVADVIMRSESYQAKMRERRISEMPDTTGDPNSTQGGSSRTGKAGGTDKGADASD
jgi:SPP1 family phage portal protein